MKSAHFPKSLIFPAAMVFCWSASAAQTADEEELGPIVIDYGQPRDEIAEEVFEDLVYDEETQTYSLIEDDESVEETQQEQAEPPPAAETNVDELKRLFELYRYALENKAYLEADTLAKRVVELSIQINGLDSHDSAKAITNLGIAQHHTQDYESAMLNFAASIGIIERIDDRLSAALINPLQGLAATQAANGRPALARQSYQRAVHISHVNEGPHNKQQIETLASIAELHVSMGDFKEAIGIQENIYAIEARKIDPKSLDIIPALENKAKWQHRLHLYSDERVTRRKIIDVIEDHEGKESLALISPLTNLGKSYLFQTASQYDYQANVSASSGEIYLRRANQIARKNPDSDWLVVEDTLLTLGDYYILSGRPNRASKIYQETWAMLTEANDARMLQTRWEHLERVNTLQRVFPPKYYVENEFVNAEQAEEGRPPPENFETGTMTFSYSVNANGRIGKLQLLETRPAELIEFGKVAGRSLRRMVYRPRLEEGVLVATPDVVYTHDFFYRPSDLPSRQPTSAPIDGDTAAESPSADAAE
jgi:hypothetical protein